MARRVIIHAGQHKTGSTSIQHYLETHHAALAAMGVFACPPWRNDLSAIAPEDRSRNAAAIAHAVLRPDLLTPGRLRHIYPVLPPQRREAGLRRVNAWIRTVAQETVVISAEAFSFARVDEEYGQLEMLCEGLDWSAVMVLRDAASWRESWRMQVTRRGLVERPDAVMGQGIFDFRTDSWLTDHDAIKRFWRGRCAFLSYESVMAESQSVLPAFLGSIGLDPARCPPWEGFRRNVSAERKPAPACLA